MVDRGSGRAARRDQRSLIAIALVAIACGAADPAAAQGGVRLLPATPPAPDTTAGRRDSGFVHGLAPPEQGFTLRRVPNPRYRPPVTGVPGLAGLSVTPVRALGHFGAQVNHRAAGAASAFTYWEVRAGEQYRGDDAIFGTVQGERDARGDRLRLMRVDARRGPWTANLGDLPALALDRMRPIHGVRGGHLRFASDPDGEAWRLFGGVPTPRPGQAAPRLGLAALLLEGHRFDASSMTFGLFGFGRGTVLAPPETPGDTLAGGGATARFAATAPLPLGALTFALGASLHTLDGHPGLAGDQTVAWDYHSETTIVSLRESRASANARAFQGDRIVAETRREDRWNMQTRFAGGRAEAHFLGARRTGGETSLDSRTVQIGTSGALGRSPWYGGADFTWDWRALTGVAERRAALHAGVTGGALSGLARVERHADDYGRRLVSATGEMTLPLPRGARVAWRPKLAWLQDRFDRLEGAVRVTWPLRRMSARVSGTVALAAERQAYFVPSLREVSLAMSFAPRLRDRGDVEVRRLGENGVVTHELFASYDAEAARYDRADALLGGRDSNRVVVRVVRAGNRSGVPQALVSLDGRELRFTDEDGFAVFDAVPPGVHVVSVEEGSLPRNHGVVSASRVFVTIERGRRPDPVVFEIARPAIRKKL